MQIDDVIADIMTYGSLYLSNTRRADAMIPQIRARIESLIAAPAAPQQADAVAQIGWADEFGNLFPMGAWKPTQRTHHDSHKTAWRPVFLHPPADEVQRLKQERDGLKNRLEWRHDGGPDGISARDETIKMQDAEVRRLQEALEPFTAIDLTTNQAVDAMDVLRARRALEGGE